MKIPLFLALLALLAFAPPARATITLTAVNGGVTGSASESVFYFPTIGTDPFCVAANQRLWPRDRVALDPTVAGQAIQFTINTDKDRSAIAGVTSLNDDSVSIRAENNSGQPIVLWDVASLGRSLSSGDTNYYYYLRYANEKTEVRFGINLSDYAGKQGFCSRVGGVSNCRTTPGNSHSQFRISIGLVKTGQSLSESNADTLDVDVAVVSCPPAAPTVTISTVSGDGRVKVINSGAQPADNVPFNKVVVFADTDANVDYNAPIAREFGSATGEYTVEPLENERPYWFSIGYVNMAGFITTDADWGGGDLPGIQQGTPMAIDGFLDHNACFIATAAYGDINDAKLVTLRAFRDKVLTRLSAGRGFIRWYYSWSPEAADWLRNHPVARSAVAIALFPVVGLAQLALWIVGNLWAGVALASGIAIVVTAALFVGTRRKKLA